MHRFTIILLGACTGIGLVLTLPFLQSTFFPEFPFALNRAAAPAATSVNAPQTTVLWSADMESKGNPDMDLEPWYRCRGCPGNEQGGGLFNSGTASARISADVNHTPGGKFSVMLTILTPSTPTSGARLFRWLEPQTYSDLYYRTWYYFPQVYTPNGDPAWWNVFQWKSKHPAGAGSSVDPVFTLNVGETASEGHHVMYFYLCPPPFDDIGGGLGNCVGQRGRPTLIAVREWTRVEAHYVCATTPTGQVTIWEDGTQLFDFSKVTTAYPDGDCQWSVNNYSNGLSPTPATLYVDDLAICQGGRCP